MNQILPQHVAIVMDGNGRWAESQGSQRVDGHRVGVDAVKKIVQCCVKKNIAVLSLFAFSSENWARPVAEINFLMQLFLQALGREIDELNEQGIHLRFTGERLQLSEALRTEMEAAESLTANNTHLILNIVINYGGKWDIVQAAKAMANQVIHGEIELNDINEDTFSTLLNTHGLPDPDLFIRTSGEQRISNFFLWQLAYTELYFSEVYWPDFTSEEFDKALTYFSTRKRRYGKISQQLNEGTHV